MPIPFSRTLDALEGDRAIGIYTLPIATIFLVAWAIWAATADVPRTIDGPVRLESDAQLHSVQAAAAGRIQSIDLQNGARVQKGDLLALIESSSLDAEIDAQKRVIRILSDVELPAIREQLAIESDLAKGEQLATGRSRESRAQLAEARVKLERARGNMERLEPLARKNIVSLQQLDDAKAETQALTSVVERWRATVGRSDREEKVEQAEANRRIAILEEELASARRELQLHRAELARMEARSEERAIVASASGRVAARRGLRPGVVVAPGDELATIVPDGEIVAVARLDPAQASGRVRPGQHARIELDAFDWARYGHLEGEVIRVAPEPLDGAVVVELALVGAPQSLQLHGLTGRASVEFERVTPFTLAWSGAADMLEPSR